MNITTPPPVEDLDPEYAEQLRTHLVKTAQQSQRRWSPWVPVVAAACGIALITTAVVVLAEPGGGPPAAGVSTPTSSPTSSPSPREAQKVSPGKSPRVSLDLGPASPEEARQNARRCLSQPTGGNGPPNTAAAADGDTATVHQARWMKTLPGEGGKVQPTKDRVLVQSLTTVKGVWAQCIDSELYEVFDPALAGIPFEKSASINAADAVIGQWRYKELPDGAPTLLFASYRFSAMPSVVSLEVRIRWTGGASPWYGVPVAGGTGYAVASQAGAVNKKRETEIDIRAFDKSGRQIFSDIEYG
ncbi:hypothetical protein [Kribbella sp. CA-294648]|uniref:hypothetical protein n=1 Tax=Kribbella sp. CA-294648 TaxID=3239948 RepID=UPI003D8D8120